MSAVAVQSPPVGFHPTFRQNQHSAAPPAALLTSAKTRQPGIITLSKPLNPRQSPKQRKATTTNGPTPVPATPKSEKSRKPRSRPSSDEEEHESPCKPRGRKEKEKEKTSPAASKRPPRQTPSPTPQLQKPSGRLARQRKGTKSTSALSATIDTPPSAPMSVPKLSNSASQPSGLSRSAPMPTSMPQSMPARMRRTLTGNGREEVPPSPSPRRVRESPKAPLTAPLASGFPSRPSHARFPSEVFNLSLDEPDDEHHEIPVLFRNRVYAGGRFQNGPDTTTLPAPSFLTGF